MLQKLLLLGCVFILLRCLFYVADMTEKYTNVAASVYCEHRTDFDSCSKEFREKTSKLMKE